MSDIYLLRRSSLDPRLSAQLAPFIYAHRPHDQPPTQKDLDQGNFIPKESPLSKDNIIDTYKAIKYNQDLEWLKRKREYNQKWKGYRSYFALGISEAT
jgi:hypothetical protein|tara:strand:- start:821 stop:1114 length:294 start_codon:yes stop_codon:yes gene_type:complete